MNRNEKRLPIIVSHDTRTGYLIAKTGTTVTVYICGLNKEFDCGDNFGFDDIEWVKAELRFTVEDFRRTAKLFDRIVKDIELDTVEESKA